MVFAAAGAAAGAVGGLGRGVIGSTILIGARLQAIERFKELSTVLGSTGGAFTRFGGSVLQTAGTLSLLGGAVRLLMNPITGLVALLEVGLATRNWLLYERAARRAQIQLQITGTDAAMAEQRLSNLQTTLGTTASRELFNAMTGFREFGDIGMEWIEIIGEMGKELEVLGFDHERIMDLMIKAAGGNLPALEALKDMFSLTDDEALSFESTMQAINKALDDTDLTNLEEANLTMKELRERTDTLVGEFINALAILPRIGAAILKEFVFAVLDTFRLLGPEGSRVMEQTVHEWALVLAKAIVEWTGMIAGWVVNLIPDSVRFFVVDGFTRNIINPIKGLIDDIKDKWNEFVSELISFRISAVLSRLLNVLPDIGISVPGLLDFAHGGEIPGALGQPQLAMVHGGETVLRPGQSSNMPTIINLYIGDEKVDSVVLHSLDRITESVGLTGRGLYHS